MKDNPSIVASSKYVTIYEGTWDTCNKIGDAVKETSINGSYSNSWNGDSRRFVTSSDPVFARGGNFNSGSNAGIFAFDNYVGGANGTDGFRTVLVP